MNVRPIMTTSYSPSVKKNNSTHKPSSTSHVSFTAASIDDDYNKKYMEELRMKDRRLDAFNKKMQYAHDHGLDPLSLRTDDFLDSYDPRTDYDNIEALNELYEDGDFSPTVY